MYILTDYRLIQTKDRPDLSSERADSSVTALAKTSSNNKVTDPSSRKRGRYKITNSNCKEKLVSN
jgi:hypothetical protein